MLTPLTQRALWFYGAGLALALLALIAALFFWPTHNTPDAFLLPVIVLARFPYTLVTALLLVIGILLYGQHYHNGLRSLFLATVTIMWAFALLFIVGVRFNSVNLFYHTDRWIDGEYYVLTAHEPTTSRCDEEMCYENFSLYECDALALNCTLHLRNVRGAGSGFTKLEFYDNTLYIYDSYTNLVVAEFPLE